jgi:hypothetical protein
MKRQWKVWWGEQDWTSGHKVKGYVCEVARCTKIYSKYYVVISGKPFGPDKPAYVALHTTQDHKYSTAISVLL